MASLQVTRSLTILSDDEMRKIYEGSITVLERTGVQFEDREIANFLKERGCTVDQETLRVKFPPHVVEASLKTCPREFTVKARNPKHDLHFNGTNVYFTSHSGPSIIDPETGQRRKPSLQDVSDMITVIDALENLHALLTLTGEPSDKPPEVGPEWVFAEIFRKTEKTTVGPSFRDCPKWIIEMASVVGEGLIGITSCTPPLFYPKQDTDALMLYAKAGYPVTVGSGIAAGGTGPVTLAGTLVQQTAEALAGIVLVQSVVPGTGVFSLTETAPIDMKTGDIAWGSIEVGLLHTALAQISRYLGIQSLSLFPMTNSLVHDEQAGYEKGMQALLMAISGINYITGGGGVYSESALSFEQLIIDNDIFGMIARYREGITVSDETLAVDVIHEVGSLRGSYLKHPHTRKWFKNEIYFPTVSNRLPHQAWIREGSKDSASRAREKAREILKTHQPVPLPDEAERELDRILKAVEKARLKKKVV
jgi:trimethylamine--corrinoid protein Co-methyltransferase